MSKRKEPILPEDVQRIVNLAKLGKPYFYAGRVIEESQVIRRRVKVKHD